MSLGYKELAEGDYRAAIILLNDNLGSYNMSALHSRLCVEKYLKYVVEYYADRIFQKGITQEDYDRALKSHNIKTLLYFLNQFCADFSIVYNMVKDLNGYYVNINYPGEDYVAIDKETAKSMIDSMIKIRSVCDSIIRNGIKVWR